MASLTSMPLLQMKEVGRGSSPRVCRVKLLLSSCDTLAAFAYKSSDFNPHLNIIKLVIIVPVSQMEKLELRESSGLSRLPKLMAEMVLDLVSSYPSLSSVMKK